MPGREIKKDLGGRRAPAEFLIRQPPIQQVLEISCTGNWAVPVDPKARRPRRERWGERSSKIWGASGASGISERDYTMISAANRPAKSKDDPEL